MMEKKRLIITIDGPSAAGKSTMAKMLAKELGYLYLDTGSMYRAVAWKMISSEVDPKNRKKIIELAESCRISFHRKGDEIRLLCEGKDISDKIREERIGEVASLVSVIPEVRRELVTIQRDMAKKGGIVLEGRDTGTVVYPDADIKFYLDASPQERGKRRFLELKDKSIAKDLENITKEIKMRDHRDSRRKHSPLKKAANAIYIDTTCLKIEEVLQIMLQKVNKLLVNQ